MKTKLTEGTFNYFKITDVTKLKTSELLQLCRNKFPAWSYWNDEELDKDFPKPKKATTRYFRKTVEADEENANKSANELKQDEQITLRERILMELAYFNETGKHLDIDNVTLCAGSRRRDGSVPRADWRSNLFSINWCNASNRDSGFRSRSYIDPSTLNLESLPASEIIELEILVTKISYKGKTYILES